MRGSSAHSSEWWEEKTRTLGGGRPPRVTVFLRSLAPPVGVHGEQERVLEQLSAYDRQGLVESVSVTVCGKAVCPDGQCSDTPTDRELLDRVGELRAWGDAADADVETPLAEREVASSVTGEQFRKIVLPRLTMGVYADGDLELVLPCEVDGACYCVDDFLEAIDRTTAPDNGVESSV